MLTLILIHAIKTAVTEHLYVRLEDIFLFQPTPSEFIVLPNNTIHTNVYRVSSNPLPQPHPHTNQHFVNGP